MAGFSSTTPRPKSIAALCWRKYKLKKITLFLFLLSAFCFLLFSFWWKNVGAPPESKDSTQRDFLITRGQSVESIGRRLQSQGFIKSALAFRLYTQLTGREKKIQAGQYQLSPNTALVGVVDLLSKGPKELWVTYPEGVRREEIAARTVKTLGMDEGRSKVFWQEFIDQTEEQEGFLFPDTYLFPKDVKAEKVVVKLRATFDSKLTEDMVTKGQRLGLSKQELVTLASIIERETRGDEEKPVVAGILVKRMNAGWPLQADATLQYVVASAKCSPRFTGEAGKVQSAKCENWWEPPTVEDKEQKSAYNTYKNRGLPPTPIANPGLISLSAAANPQDSPHWFYLHDKDGQIHYAKTIEEHASNIEKYLK